MASLIGVESFPSIYFDVFTHSSSSVKGSWSHRAFHFHYQSWTVPVSMCPGHILLSCCKGAELSRSAICQYAAEGKSRRDAYGNRTVTQLSPEDLALVALVGEPQNAIKELNHFCGVGYHLPLELNSRTKGGN